MAVQDSAEITALQAFGWLVGQPDLFGGFLNLSGAAQSDLPQLARDPRFLAAVVDYLLEADERVIACCDDLNLPYTALRTARAGLPGGLDPHWT
jgi:hypothetical protein